MRNEIQKSIISIKNHKVPSPDGVHLEMLKLICETGLRFFEILGPLFNRMYDCGKFPAGWTNSTLIAIPKMLRAKLCYQHRLISLNNNITQVFTKMRSNNRRITNRIQERLWNVGSSLTSAGLIRRCTDMDQDAYLYFIVFYKVFDNVQHRVQLRSRQ